MINNQLKIILFVIMTILYHSESYSEGNTVDKRTLYYSNRPVKDILFDISSNFNYKLDYKGPNRSPKISVQVDASNVSDSVKSVLREAKYKNTNFSIDDINKKIAVRILDFNTINESREGSTAKAISLSEENQPLTREQIYDLKEQTEKEEAKQHEMSKPLSFEQILTLENNNLILSNINIDPIPLNSTQLEALNQEKHHTEIDAIPLTKKQIKLLTEQSSSINDPQF